MMRRQKTGTKRRSADRPYTLIALKAYHDTDQDIVKWWRDVEMRQGGQILRGLIRQHIGTGAAAAQGNMIAEIAGLRRTVEGLAAIIQALEERIASGVVLAAPAEPGGGRLSKEAAERRAKKVAGRGW